MLVFEVALCVVFLYKDESYVWRIFDLHTQNPLLFRVLHLSLRCVDVLFFTVRLIHLLRKVCLEYIDLHAQDSLCSRGFCELDVDMAVTVLKRDQLDAPEIGIFQAVLQWARARVERYGYNAHTFF